MLRRKKPAEGPEPKGPAEEEEEQRGPLHARKKRSFVDAFIVISDSDGEEAQEESGLQKKRTKQQLDRAKFAAKRQIARMSEDEQFALALRMSEQEARQANCQEEEEEELVRKAIAASLNSCQPSEAPPTRAAGMPMQSRPAEPGRGEAQGAVPPCPDCPPSESSAPPRGTPADLAKSPLVVLTRLSQEVVESSLLSSVTVSPGKSEGKSPPLARSSSREMLPSPTGEDPFSLSPSLARIAPSAWQLTPRRLFPVPCGSPQATQLLAGPGSAACSPAVLRRSRAVELGALPRTRCGAGGPRGAPHCGHSSAGAEPGEGRESAPALRTEEAGDTVHYYWGIPFCPKGVDPNQYTQVILCQLEVYQKTLKQAQRQLLQKKEFGEPMVPCPSAPEQREPESGANGVPSGTAQGDSAGRREPEGAAWLLPTRAREPEHTPWQPLEAEKNSMSEDEPTTSYCQASQGLCAEDLAEDGEPMQITQSISALTPLGSKRSPDIGAGSPAAEEITVCPETQPSPTAAIEPEREDASPQAAGEEEAGGTVPGGAVLCPLCERGFPAAEIELHAMYCDGHAGQGANGSVPVLAQCPRETRSRADRGRAAPGPVDTDKREKCYLCKALVPLAQYPRHVESCLRAARDVQGHRRLRSAKGGGRSDGRLLSMLEMSEGRTAGADGGARLTAAGEPRRSPEAEEDAECSLAQESARPPLVLSDGPVPKAAGCLGDFAEQTALRPGARHHGRGSRRRRRKC